MEIKNGPNEGHEEGQEEFHFYYNREERIKNAPKIVQDYYEGKGPTLKKGFFRTLVGTRLNRMMLMAIAFCMLVVIFVNLFGNKANIGKICGYEAELTAFSFDEAVYVSVHFHPLKATLEKESAHLEQLEKSLTEAICTFNFEDKDGANVGKKESSAFIKKNEFFVRTNINDYDIIKVRVNVKIGNETLDLLTTVGQKK